MKAAEKRVIAAAMAIYRWHKDDSSGRSTYKIGIRRYKAFDKACAALSKARASRGRKAT